MYTPNQTAWEQFSKQVQLVNIAAELVRATKAGSREDQTHRDAKVTGAYERALALIDASLADPKWRDERKRLYTLRNAIASLYVGIPGAAISNYISEQLLQATS